MRILYQHRWINIIIDASISVIRIIDTIAILEFDPQVLLRAATGLHSTRRFLCSLRSWYFEIMARSHRSILILNVD